MTSKNVDKRVRRTKLDLTNAFVQLIKEKGYSNVSVTDIVNKSDYNRATFYAHYNNKDDLTNEIIEKMSMELEKVFLRNITPSKLLELTHLPASSVHVFEYICKNSDFYDLLKYTDSIPKLRENIIETIKTFQKKIALVGVQGSHVNEPHFIIYRTYGTFGIISEWIKSNYDESSEEIAKQALEIINTHYPHTQMKM